MDAIQSLIGLVKIETIVRRTGLASVLSPDETEIVLMIVVGGRARCCVENEETLTAISEYFVAKGKFQN